MALPHPATRVHLLTLTALCPSLVSGERGTGAAQKGNSYPLELIQQALDKLHLVDPSLPLGVVQAARDDLTAPIVVASVQTLSRRARLARLVPDFRTIVIDEAHHSP